MRDVQLFDLTGNYVTTVQLPHGHAVVIWAGRYFYLNSGRYVETRAHTSNEPQR